VAENSHDDTFADTSAAVGASSGAAEVVRDAFAYDLRFRDGVMPKVVGEFSDSFAFAVEDVAHDDAVVAFQLARLFVPRLEGCERFAGK
jgi:hypothetical protein